MNDWLQQLLALGGERHGNTSGAAESSPSLEQAESLFSLGQATMDYTTEMDYNFSFTYHDFIKQLNLTLQTQFNRSRNRSYNSNEELYAVPTGIVVLLALLYGSISLVAVFGNGLVIFVIAKDKRMQTVTNIFIANLALADIIIGLFTTPFQFQPALQQRWDLPYFLCSVAPSFKVLSVSVSVLTLTVISFDRYVAVMYPLKAGFNKKYAILGLIMIWVIGAGSSFPEGYYHRVGMVNDTAGRPKKPFCHPLWPTENFGKYYHIYLILIQYLCPLLVINFSYARIACRIWGTKAPGNTIDRDNVRQRNKKKVVKMLIIVLLLFVICWMPYQVYSLVSELAPNINKYKYIQVVWFCFNWLAMSNSCYNPFIYGLLNEKFKREYRLLFSKSRCMRKRFQERHSTSFTGNDHSDEMNGGKRITLTYRTNNNRQTIQGTRVGTTASRYTRVHIKDVEETSQTTL